MPELEDRAAVSALDQAVEIDLDDLRAISTEITWPEVDAHGGESSCECVTVAVVAGLIALGYHVHRAQDRPEDPQAILHALRHRLDGEVPVDGS